MFRSRLLADLAFDGRSGLQFAGALLNGAHDAQKIAAINLLDVSGRIALLEQGTGEGREFVVGAELRWDTTHAVEVRADANMIDAANLHRMVDLGNNIRERGRWQLGGRLLLKLLDSSLSSDRVLDLHCLLKPRAQ